MGADRTAIAFLDRQVGIDLPFHPGSPDRDKGKAPDVCFGYFGNDVRDQLIGIEFFGQLDQFGSLFETSQRFDPFFDLIENRQIITALPGLGNAN
jgi:hypothetical protein